VPGRRKVASDRNGTHLVASRGSFGHPRRRSRRHVLRGAAVEAPSPWFAIAAGLLVYSIAVLRVTWVSDDGFISARVAANAVCGLGLVSNPGERVQSFTNPLWTLLLMPGLRLGLSAYWAQLSLGLVTARRLNRGSV